MNRIFQVIALLIFATANSQYFADTKGELQVSNSGTLTYTLPIANPPSIKNVAPTISLAYTSGTKAGIAGQGWTVNGISNISRIATRKDIDGFVDGVDFDDNDKLALNGQRLILKSGTYWANGSVYETEIQSNLKVALFTQAENYYFVVTENDGSRTWYGSSGTGTNICSKNAWYIVRFEDAHGNYIVYNYEDEEYIGSYLYWIGQINYVNTHQYYIKDIQFSGNTAAGVSLVNKIKFNYRNERLKRRERDFIRGEYSYAFNLLENIEVETGGELFKRYALTYVADPVLGYERLKQIQEFNAAEEPSNPVIFTYDTTQNLSAPISTYYQNNLSTKDVKVTGDFDGDGKVDFVTSGLLYKNLFIGGTNIPPLVLPTIADNRRFFASTTLSGNKLNQFQSLVYANESSAQTEFKIYNSPDNTVSLSYTKTIAIDNSITHDTSRDHTDSYNWPASTIYSFADIDIAMMET